MRKIYWLFYLVTAVMIAACTHEEEDLFDSSSATRADAAVKADLEILTGATNGWLMEYFPESQQTYGGYNILVKFSTDGKVTTASELFEATDTKTSLYSMKQSAGVVLSFDTYNDIFHFFAEPGDPAAIGGNGYGLEGDYDFLVLEASAEKVVLKGKKSGSHALLTPVKKEWSTYLDEVQKADASMLFSQYTLKINGEELPVAANYRTLVITVGDGQTVTIPYIVTPTGFKFYESTVVNEKTLTGFKFDSTKGNYGQFTEEGNSDIQLIPEVLPLNQLFVEEDWYFTFSHLSDPVKPYFLQAYKGSKAEGEEIAYMSLGSGVSGNYAFNFKSGDYSGFLTYNYKLEGDDLVTLTFGGRADSNGQFYYQNCGYNYVISAIGSGTTYKIIADNVLNPSYLTLTDIKDPTWVMTLVKQSAIVTRFPINTSYPFNN